MKRVLVVGLPRSGTTWVGRVLAATLSTELVDEPDNHFVSPYAYKVKRRLAQGSYPRLAVNDEAPDYGSLWKYAFAIQSVGTRLGTRARRRISRDLLQRSVPAHVTRAIAGTVRPGSDLRVSELFAVPEQPQADAEAVVVKSVYAALAIDWISAVCAPRVVVVVRSPLNVVSSWVEMEWLADDPLEPLAPQAQRQLVERYDAPMPSPQWTALERAAWLVGALTSAISDLGDEPGRRVVVTHEWLTETGEEGFRHVADALGLDWDSAAASLLRELDRPGQGFETARTRADLNQIWRSRLTPEQAREALRILDSFPAGRSV